MDGMRRRRYNSDIGVCRRAVYLLETLRMAAIPAPFEWIEFVSELRLPARSDQRLQSLMDRNNEGQLTNEERAELESLVELSETLSLARTEALILLGRKPE